MGINCYRKVPGSIPGRGRHLFLFPSILPFDDFFFFFGERRFQLDYQWGLKWLGLTFTCTDTINLLRKQHPQILPLKMYIQDISLYNTL